MDKEAINLDEIIDINENNESHTESVEFLYKNNRQWAIKPDREEKP